MNIWMINHYAAPPVMAGGTRHYNFARELIKKGHKVLIIAANYNHFSHSYIDNSKIGKIDYDYDVPFLWIPTPAYLKNSIARFWNMLTFSFRVFQTKLPQPDIIIGSSPHLFAALSAEILAKKFKKPFVLEIRDIWPESLVDLGRISVNHPLIKIMYGIEKYLYKRANKIISLLPAADKYLMKCGVKAENILWLPNAIDTEVISVTPPVNSDKFTFMYAGAHGLANDLDTVIAAAKILQEKFAATHIKICLIGNGPEKLRLKEMAEIKKINIVEFYDPVAKNAIYTELNKADAYLMLLKNSPVFKWGISPNKLFDYLLMSRPVIFGVDTPFNPIEKFNAGITVKPSDPESLAKAMYQLSLMPKEELNAMGSRGKDFVLQYHGVQKLTDSLEQMLTDVIISNHKNPL